MPDGNVGLADVGGGQRELPALWRNALPRRVIGLRRGSPADVPWLGVGAAAEAGGCDGLEGGADGVVRVVGGVVGIVLSLVLK
jgi:hypothetical protein